MKDLFLTLYSFIIVAGSFLTIFMIADISNSIQFQDNVFDIRIDLYFPVVPILVIWVYCILKYFSPPKKVKKTKPFADPSKKSSELHITNPISQDANEEKPFYRTFLFIGTIFGVFIPFLLYSIYCQITIPSTVPLLSTYRFDMRNETESTLINLAASLNKFIKSNPDDIPKQTNSEWKNVFKSDLTCFAPEKQALTNVRSIINASPNTVQLNLSEDTSSYTTIPMRNYIILTEPYEFWIDNNDPQHFKIRYNTKLQEDKNFDPYKDQKFYYKKPQNKFYAADRTDMKFRSYTDNHLYSSDVGILEYDSKTKECSYIYDNWWDNFKENYKWVIYLFDYLVMLLICFLMIFYCRRLMINRMKKYNQ